MRRWRPELDRLRHDAATESRMDDDQFDQIEWRVTALEEVTAARWPRSMFLRWRLARDIRASVAGYGWVGRDFASRRAQAIGDGWPVRPGDERPARRPGKGNTAQ